MGLWDAVDGIAYKNWQVLRVIIVASGSDCSKNLYCSYMNMTSSLFVYCLWHRMGTNRTQNTIWWTNDFKMKSTLRFYLFCVFFVECTCAQRARTRGQHLPSVAWMWCACTTADQTTQNRRKTKQKRRAEGERELVSFNKTTRITWRKHKCSFVSERWTHEQEIFFHFPSSSSSPSMQQFSENF